MATDLSKSPIVEGKLNGVQLQSLTKFGAWLGDLISLVQVDIFELMEANKTETPSSPYPLPF